MIAELKKPKIDSFTDPECDGSPESTFVVMFNPSSYSEKYAVEYDTEQGKGTAGVSQRYKKSTPTEFSLDFLLDGTGASIDPAIKPKVVSELVSEFLRVVYTFDGSIHRPPYLKLAWGTLLVKCVFKGADIKYTLFSPSGDPLRATITATFYGTIDDKKRVAEQREESPDLVRVHIVKEGETLPLLAHRFYGQPIHYLELARHNGLNNFRKLEEGRLLVFPPLAKG